MERFAILKDENGNDQCILSSSNWAIPLDPDNSDYQRYLAWVAEGNTPAVTTDPAYKP